VSRRLPVRWDGDPCGRRGSAPGCTAGVAACRRGRGHPVGGLGRCTSRRRRLAPRRGLHHPVGSDSECAGRSSYGRRAGGRGRDAPGGGQPVRGHGVGPPAAQTSVPARRFRPGPGEASRWRRSTRQQRSGTGPFAPSSLRKAGSFAVDDYRSHCDRGSHPTPLGTFLVRFEHGDSSDERTAVGLAWRDVASHLVQVSQQVIELGRTLDLAQLVKDVDVAASSVAAWLAEDGQDLSGFKPPHRVP